MILKHIARFSVAALLSITLVLPQLAIPAAGASERALYLYYTHTKETARIVFKRNGQFVQSGLNELNYFLRDWRRNEPTKMDPRLFDLIWEVYNEVGASQPVNIVSAYRSPKTNAMLRETSSGVAENSQHTKGHAMDFFIPGVPLAKLRAVAMRKQVGGVGFYPTSGSPFVHLDTGSVRAWPRMTRAQLKEIFPDGRTMHLPTDGKPLSQEGYQVAMAEWKTCHAYPCNGGSSGTQVASNGGSGRSLMDMFFGDKDTPVQPAAPTAVARASAPIPAPAPAPGPTQVAAAAPAQPAIPQNAPFPVMRPANLGGTAPVMDVAEAAAVAVPFSTTGSAPLDPAELAVVDDAPFPVAKPESIRVATAGSIRQSDAVTAIAALAAPIPQPPRAASLQPQSEMVTAYLSTAPEDVEAQRALESIIAAETTAAIAAPSPTTRMQVLPPLANEPAIHTASLAGGTAPNSELVGLFDETFRSASQNAPVAEALAAHLASRSAPDEMRKPDLIAPDLEHVADVFMAPVALTSDHYADIWDHDEADFSPATEMGPYVAVLGAAQVQPELSSTRFVTTQPTALATN